MSVLARHLSSRIRALAAGSERGSAAVEYVGLAVVVSMLMTSAAAVVDSATGQRIVDALVEKLIEAIR